MYSYDSGYFYLFLLDFFSVKENKTLLKENNKYDDVESKVKPYFKFFLEREEVFLFI